MQLTKNFTLDELKHSNIAIRFDIDNSPNPVIINNLKLLCENILQPIRDKFGSIKITSGYRCNELNKRVGGSKTSSHKRGQAADFVPVDNVDLINIVEYIYDNLEWDQLILYDNFIHCSFKLNNNRKQLSFNTIKWFSDLAELKTFLGIEEKITEKENSFFEEEFENDSDFE